MLFLTIVIRFVDPTCYKKSSNLILSEYSYATDFSHCPLIEQIPIEFRIVDRRTLLQNSENSLKVISSDSPILSYPTPKHYIRFYNGRCNNIISNASRAKLTNNQADVFASTYRRRTHFMDSCLRDYHLMLKAADAEMENAINQMPLSKWE